MSGKSRIDLALNGKPAEWYYNKENFGKYLLIKHNSVTEIFETPIEALRRAAFYYQPGEVEVVECLPKNMPWLED